MIPSCVLIAGCWLLAGCAGRDYHEPTPPAPAAWSANANATDTIAIERWWTTFRDPGLDALVENVLTANHDLRLATERLRESRAALGVAEAGYYPTVNVGAGVERSRASENGPLGPRAGGINTVYQAGFDASWEIDVFGSVGRSVEAASADLAALEENRRDVQVSLAAETVRTWLDGRTALARQAVAQRLCDNARRQQALVEERHRAGLADSTAVANAESLVAQADAALPPLTVAIAQARQRLGLLIGQTAGADLGTSAEMPTSTDVFALPLPADLIRQRPDLRRAERDLAAATARVGVAEADLYPRISLTGGFGQLSAVPDTFSDAGSSYWSIGPSIRWPVFSAGRIRNQVKAADSRAEQAAIRFEQACLRAYAEVEDALVELANDRLREQRLAEVERHRARSAAMQIDRQRSGLADGLAVLRADYERLLAADQILIARRASGTDLAALAKSLGGGWR